MMAGIVDTWENPMNGDTTLRLDDGRCVTLSRADLEINPLLWWLETMSITQDTSRVDVIQYGRKVGELAGFWHPRLAKSSSFLYDYRHGDLVKQDGKWIASRTLGSGDLDCLIGFVRTGEPE